MNHILRKLNQYSRLARIDRPIGTLLLLWPTLWALWIAGQGRPEPSIVIVFILGTFLMRCAGCVINDYADRNIDGFVARTRDRPLVTAEVTKGEALGLFIGLSLLALALVLVLNNLLVLKLALIGILLTVIYPFTKRYFQAPQLILGMAFAWGIPMAFAAQSKHLPLLSWILFIATMLWIIAYDTIYAMVDRVDDKKLGVKSSAILFGEYEVFIITLIQSISILILFILGFVLKLAFAYYLFLTVAACLVGYQYYLIKNRHVHQCFRAFLHNNWFGFIIFLAVVLGYMR